jgi:hypothetical protein
MLREWEMQGTGSLFPANDDIGFKILLLEVEAAKLVPVFPSQTQRRSRE